MSSKLCEWPLEEVATNGSNRNQKSFEPQLTLLVKKSPQDKKLFSATSEEVMVISGKITVSF